MKRFVLTIAGSDTTSGAGVQADIKTFRDFGLYGLNVVTAVTSQNHKGVQDSFTLPISVIQSQLKAVSSSFKIGFVKTGMLCSSSVVKTVAEFISRNRYRLLIDPVIYSKNNYRMLDQKGIGSLKKYLIPLAYLVTPNLHEAEIICGFKIKTFEDLENAAFFFTRTGAENVLIKGGHFNKYTGISPGNDILYDGRKFYMFPGKFMQNKKVHGTGCIFSSAIAANLTLGKSLTEAIILSKCYLQERISASVSRREGFSFI